MDKRLAKRRNKKDGSSNSMDGDRLSELPQPILHHILSFLTQKEAVQTCVLSKSWRHLGPTRPKIDFRVVCSKCLDNKAKFCENCFGKNNKTFLSVLDKTFQRYHDQNIPMHEFHFDMLEVDSKPTLLLQKWIPILITPNLVVKTFELDFVRLHSETGYFDLPLVIFQLKSLQKLDLQRCRLGRIDSVRLQHLRTLNFSFVRIKEDTLEKIMSSCPLIENVSLVDCKDVRSFKSINKHHNLKDFCLSFYLRKNLQKENHSIEIDAPNLEKLSIRNCSNWKSFELPNLKSLYLQSVRLPALLFDDFASKFPCLEKLEISCCYGFEEIHLASPSIKSLIIDMGPSIRVNPVIIDAANILYFEYSGYPPPSPFSFTTSSSEWKSNIEVCPKEDSGSLSICLLKLNAFLKALSRSQISLCISYYAPFPKKHIEGGFYEPIVVEHLELRSCDSSSTSLRDFLKSLLRICRPRYISLDCGWNSEYNKTTAQSLWKVLVQKRVNSWRQDLEELTIELLDENKMEWYSTVSAVLCACPDEQKIRFRLEWRD